MNFNFSAIAPANTDKGIWFLFKDNALLISKDNSTIPVLNETQIAGTDLKFINYLGTCDSVPCFTALLDSDAISEDYHTQDLLTLYRSQDSLSADMFNIAFKAYEILNWDRTHQYCGQCGSSMNRSPIDFSKICPRCGLQNYPRISPAIITAVIKENKILLARHPRSEMFSVLAGYVEAGETLENAVRREVMEEVNIEVKNIRYFASEPWVFSHALMVAYTAEYQSGEIRVDGEEIEEAAWFSAEEIPQRIPRKVSISRKLIDWFLNRNVKQ